MSQLPKFDCVVQHNLTVDFDRLFCRRTGRAAFARHLVRVSSLVPFRRQLLTQLGHSDHLRVGGDNRHHSGGHHGGQDSKSEAASG